MKSRIFLLCTALHVSALNAQTPPLQPLSVDLARYYFSSLEAETTARADLNSALERLTKFQGQIHTGQQLLGALQSYEEVLKLYRHHEAYLRLRCSQNRKDPACQANGKLGSEVNAETAFLVPEILAIPEKQLQAFRAAEPGLKSYQFALEDIRRDTRHVLPKTEQAFLDRLNPEIADWQYDLFEQILAGISFGTVQTATGPLDVVRQRMGDDAVRMYEWFDRVGFSVDRAALRREFPDVAFHDFESWVKTRDWNALLQSA